MRSPTLKQLRALVTVLESRHFGEAARQLNVTQPTLSEQIKALEDNLGGPLVDRRLMTGTPLGADVAGRARIILRDIEDLVDVARGTSAGYGGLVRIGMLPTVGPYFMPAILKELHAQVPTLRLHVSEDRQNPLFDRLRMGKLDVVLGPVWSPASWITSHVVLNDPIFVGMPVDHRLASAETITALHLSGEIILRLGKNKHLGEFTEDLARRCGAQVSDKFEGTSLDAIRQMVATGMGISLFPGLYVRSEISRGNDVLVRPFEKPLSREIAFMWRTGAPRAAQFAELTAKIGRIAQAVFQDMIPEEGKG